MKWFSIFAGLQQYAVHSSCDSKTTSKMVISDTKHRKKEKRNHWNSWKRLFGLTYMWVYFLFFFHEPPPHRPCSEFVPWLRHRAGRKRKNVKRSRMAGINIQAVIQEPPPPHPSFFFFKLFLLKISKQHIDSWHKAQVQTLPDVGGLLSHKKHYYYSKRPPPVCSPRIQTVTKQTNKQTRLLHKLKVTKKQKRDETHRTKHAV